MSYDLKGFEPIFGEAKPECNGPPKLNPFIFRVFASDPSHLTLHVSDFRSYTWESRLSVDQLEDLRDSIGISGSWADFVNYVVSSLKSKDVKLVMEWQPNLNGAVSAKLVARKSKGMPLLSVSLSRLTHSAASEAMANMSLELFKAYNFLQDTLVTEQDRGCRLTQVISTDEDKSLIVKRKLDAAMNMEKPSFQKTTDVGSTASPMNSETSSVTAALNTNEKQPAEVQSSKVAHRVVPAFRRAKVRGAVLHDSDEEGG